MNLEPRFDDEEIAFFAEHRFRDLNPFLAVEYFFGGEVAISVTIQAGIDHFIIWIDGKEKERIPYEKQREFVIDRIADLVLVEETCYNLNEEVYDKQRNGDLFDWPKIRRSAQERERIEKKT